MMLYTMLYTKHTINYVKKITLNTLFRLNYEKKEDWNNKMSWWSTENLELLYFKDKFIFINVKNQYKDKNKNETLNNIKKEIASAFINKKIKKTFTSVDKKVKKIKKSSIKKSVIIKKSVASLFKSILSSLHQSSVFIIHFIYSSLHQSSASTTLKYTIKVLIKFLNKKLRVFSLFNINKPENNNNIMKIIVFSVKIILHKQQAVHNNLQLMYKHLKKAVIILDSLID